jgi:ABC-type amino acid transport substrate-binding protein
MLKLKYIKHRNIRAGENKMAKIITVGLVVIMLVVGFGVGLVASPFFLAQKASATDSVWSNIKQTGVIRVGTDPSWPPYEQLDESTNKIVGFEVDLTNAVAAKLNLTVEWQSVSFDNIITSVQQNKLDMGVSGFSITADRLEQVTFTMPHSTTRAQVIMLKTTIDSKQITTINSLEDLKNLDLTVGTQSGTTEQEELQTAGVDIRSWNDFASAIQDMASANPSVQAVYAETPITTAWIAQYKAAGKDIGIVYDQPYYPCAFLVSKNANSFLDKFNGAMADIIQSGQLDELKAKWHA